MGLAWNFSATTMNNNKPKLFLKNGWSIVTHAQYMDIKNNDQILLQEIKENMINLSDDTTVSQRWKNITDENLQQNLTLAHVEDFIIH